MNAISFLAMIEMGADGIKTDQQDTFKWVNICALDWQFLVYVQIHRSIFM